MEADAETIKRTQEILGNQIKKPVLTEKLLKKPPFRFILDITNTIVNDSEYFHGLFTPNELKAENCRDKNTKLTFLQKIIDVVELSTGETITAKASKILAGLEPIETNRLLQLIGRALEKKTKSAAAIAQVLHGRRPVVKSYKQELSPQRRREVIKRKQSLKQEQMERLNRASRPTDEKKLRKKVQSKNEGKKESETSSQNRRSSLGGQANDRERPTDQPSPAKPALKGILKNQGEKIPEHLLPPMPDHQDTSDSDDIRTEINLNEEPDDLLILKSLKSASRRPGTPIPGGRRRLSEEDQETDPEAPEALNNQISSPSPVVPATTNPPVYAEPHEIADNYEELDDDQSEMIMSRSYTRHEIARPPSARPAAPRIREKMVQVVDDRPPTGKVTPPNILYDGTGYDEDDEEYLIKDLPGINPFESATELDLSFGNHGHLVSQILETKKELEGIVRNKDPESKKVKIEYEEGVTEKGRMRDREATKKDMKGLRFRIQSLTRSAHPLGKLMDFLQEDMDTMQKEMETWREENETMQRTLNYEYRLLQQTTEPLVLTHSELEQDIVRQQENIKGMKTLLMRNELKIMSMMTNGKLRQPN